MARPISASPLQADPVTVPAAAAAAGVARLAGAAAERGYVDDVILPRQTRPRLIRALELLQAERVTGPKRKHGNIPL